MGGGQDRHALAAASPQELPQFGARHGVDAAGRLVEDEGAGPADTGQDDIQAPGPPARQGTDRLGHIGAEAELGDNLIDRPRIGVQAGYRADRLAHLESLGQTRLLELDANEGALWGGGAHSLAVHQDLARGRQAQGGDHLHGGGLARAVGADQYHLTRDTLVPWGL